MLHGAHIRRLLLGVIAIWVLSTALAPSSRAWDLNGLLDLTSVWAEVEGRENNTIRQDYLINLNHSFTPYVDFRAGFRYYRFDFAQILGTDTFTEQIQPNGELRWNHPLFSMSASGFRRRVRGLPFTANLTTDNFSFTARSIESTRYPSFNLRYDSQHVYDRLDVEFKDVGNKRIQAGADWLLRDHDLSYVYSHRVTDNVISGLAGTEDRHNFRWRGNFRPDAAGRWRIGSNYRFDFSDTVDEVQGGSRFLQSIPVRLGLYGLNDAPGVGSLDPVPTLSDGNTTVPTVPNINIGGSTTGVNIGADLGVRRPVAAVYVWMDRASVDVLSWRVYLSEDNLNWDLHTGAPIYRFNAAVNRYEIEFAQVETRYFKVVKDGLNVVPTVLVTEITAFEELPQNEKVRRSVRAHLLDLRAEYQATRKLSTALDGTLLRDDGPGALGDRTQLDYTLRGLWEPSQTWSHQLRWEQSLRWYGADRTSENDRGVFYIMLWEPWRTLHGNVSLNQRKGFVGSAENTQIRSALARLTGTPVPELNLTVEGGRSDNWDFLGGNKSRVYLTRAILDGRLFSFLDLSFTWSYRDIFVEPLDDQRYRNTYSLGFAVRFTRTIYGRGNVGLVNDVTKNTNQDYLLGWNILPSLSLIGQYFLQATDRDFRSERYSANLTWTLSGRSMVFGRHIVQDFRRAGGLLTKSYELGLRIGF